METLPQSSQEIPAAEIRVGLIKNDFRSLRAWCAKRKVNYNTAWAAMHGRRDGPITRKIYRALRRDANV